MKRLGKSLLVLSFIALLPSHVMAQSSGVQLRATDALEGLSDEYRFNRRLGGGLTIAGGGALLLVGLANRPDEQEYATTKDYDNDRFVSNAFIISGAVLAGAGALQLAIPSEPERAWGRVETIQDSERRESRAYSELNQLANNARSSRLLGGGLSMGISAFYLLSSPADDSVSDAYLYNGLIFGAIGLSQLLVESPAERTFNRLESQRQSSASTFDTDWGLAVSQQGAGIGLSVRF